MGSIFDFNGIENCEQAIRKTWDEFRECLYYPLLQIGYKNDIM